MTGLAIVPPSHDAEPCIVCGAPITGNIGHDVGCMADPASRDFADGDSGAARARARAYADAVRRHDARAAEARSSAGYACFDAIRAGATSGELAVDTGWSRQHVETIARQAWARSTPAEILEPDPELESREGMADDAES